MSNITYRYLVVPFFVKMPTRHEAVGYKCWTDRLYDVDSQIVPFRADSDAEEIIEYIDEQLGAMAIPERLGGEASGV